MKQKISYILLGIILISTFACMDDDDYPVIPFIEYKGFYKYYNQENQLTEGVFVITFTDGDGDIGLDASDTLPPFEPGGDYFYNFIIDLYKKKDGNYEKVVFPDTTFSYNSRIPKVNFDGNSKAIKGELEYTFNLQLMKQFLDSDTIMIETFIYDRALNKSNVIQSDDISLD